MNAEFSQRPFVAGSLIGIRSFRVAADNTLTGCVHQLEWTAGVNEAVCVPTGSARAAQSMANLSQGMARLTAAITGKPIPVDLTKKPKHQVSQLNCTCGFYAYFDLQFNPHHVGNNMLGLVEGFGITTVGSRGFRASKARVVALIESDPTMPARRGGGVFSMAGCNCPLCQPDMSHPSDLAAISARYGNLPIFSTVAAAVAEFPLTPVEQPEPEPMSMVSWAQSMTFTFTVTPDQAAVWGAIAGISAAEAESPAQRALRLRRERNTGPQSRIGLDGVARRNTR